MIRRLTKLSSLIFKIPKFTFTNNINNNNDPKYSDDVMNKLKQNAQTFYDTVVEDESIIDLKDPSYFNIILAENQQKLLLLYFYAKWSPECSLKATELEQKVKQHEGTLKLLKVDIDQHPQIATSMQIRSVPFVAIVTQQEIVGVYQKQADQVKFDETLDKFLSLTSGEDVGVIVFREIEEMLRSGNITDAIETCKVAVASPKFEKYHGKLMLYMVSAYQMIPDVTNATQMLEQFNKTHSDDLEDSDIRDLHELINDMQEKLLNKEDSAELTEMLRKLDSDPTNLQQRLDISTYCIDNLLYDHAIKQLLDIVKIDRNWNDRAGQKRLLEVFSKLGSGNSIVVEGRKQLAKILY